MQSIEFAGKVRVSGKVVLVTIPKQYIRDGHLVAGEWYRFQVRALTQEEKDAVLGNN